MIVDEKWKNSVKLTNIKNTYALTLFKDFKHYQIIMNNIIYLSIGEKYKFMDSKDIDHKSLKIHAFKDIKLVEIPKNAKIIKKEKVYYSKDIKLRNIKSEDIYDIVNYHSDNIYLIDDSLINDELRWKLSHISSKIHNFLYLV